MRHPATRLAGANRQGANRQVKNKLERTKEPLIKSQGELMYVQNDMDRAGQQLHCRRQAGFSLTEVLVTVGLLAILSGIATVSYNSYTNTARAQAIRRTLSALENGFLSCMSFNKNQVDKCDSFAELEFRLPKTIYRAANDMDYKSNQLHAKVTRSTTKVCFTVRRWRWNNGQGKEGTRGCAQFDNGRLIRRCFETTIGGTKMEASCGDGNCCPKCANTYICEVGKGAKSS